MSPKLLINFTQHKENYWFPMSASDPLRYKNANTLLKDNIYLFLVPATQKAASTQKAAFSGFVLINAACLVFHWSNMLTYPILSYSSYQTPPFLLYTPWLSHTLTAHREWWTCNFAGSVYFQKTNIVPVLTSIRRLIWQSDYSIWCLKGKFQHFMKDVGQRLIYMNKI